MNYKKQAGEVSPQTLAKIIIFSFILFIIIAMTSLSIISASSIGVVDTFGTVSHETLEPGVHFLNPFAMVQGFSLKTRSLEEKMEVPSREGLTVSVDATVLHKINKDNARDIYLDMGAKYEEILLLPSVRSVVREVTSNYDAKSLYTSDRKSLEGDVKRILQEKLKDKGILIEDVLFREITLPIGLSNSIEEKLKMEQDSERMKFVLLKEQKEAERKRIEAKGIADFQSIVTKGISEPLLQWKGIEATEKLANSTNSKVVIIGDAKHGLPMVFQNS